MPPYFCGVVEIRILPTDYFKESLYCSSGVIVTIQLIESAGKGHRLIAKVG